MEKASKKDGTVSFHVTNCDAKTALFISGIIGIFCDPIIDNALKEEILDGHFGVTGNGSQVRVFSICGETLESQSGIIYPPQH